jgi:hypothetical protein
MLFNGHDLTGWKPVEKASFRAENGELVASGNGAGWLRTEQEYQDFDLRLDFVITHGGNSGVFIHAPDYGRSSRLGFEIQILDDAGKPANKNSTGSLYDIVAPAKNMMKPAGEWNQERILVTGSHIQVWLNGERIQDVHTDDAELNAKMDNDHKPERRFKKGYIGLQDHGAQVRFRNIRIRELKKLDAHQVL